MRRALSVSRHEKRGASGKSELGETRVWLPRNAVSYLSVHATSVVAVVAVLGIVGLRLLLKTAKIGLLMVAPILMYLLHLR